MTRPLSTRTENIAASLTVAIDTLAKQMIAEGKDVVSLGAGEPDFPTPEPICKGACDAISEGKTRYTAPVGILDVRKEVCNKLKRDNGLDYAPEQIIMTSGAKHAVFNSLAALVNPGDEIIIPAPYWVTYPELVKWLGGTPVFVQAGIENSFKITAKQLKEAITEKTKAILINNPCNPTGSVYSESELAELAKVIVENDIYCISDEVYEYFVYDGKFTSIASFDGMAERTIVVNGFSKSHCMTGWRVGYDAAPEQHRAVRSPRRTPHGHGRSGEDARGIPQEARLHGIAGFENPRRKHQGARGSILPVRPRRKALRQEDSRRRNHKRLHRFLQVPARDAGARHRAGSGLRRRQLRAILVCGKRRNSREGMRTF